MATYNKISLAQIDVDALSDYVVAKKKLVYRSGGESVVASNKAQDVEKVSGINANNIAVAIGAADRTTINNALNLNGHPESYYMTTAQGTSVMDKERKLRNYYGEDLQNIKDELYTLRQELAKNGFIEDRGEYTGYIDTFRAKAPKHIHKRLAVVRMGEDEAEIFIADKKVFDSLDVYDFIALENAEVQCFDIRQILEKDKTRQMLILDKEVDSKVRDANNGIGLYLSYGINDEGMFKFARAAELSMGEENHTGLSDDTYRIMKRTLEPRTGFAYSFRIPEEKQGYVMSFEICAKAYGSPGEMICYLIDARDLDNFHNPVQAAADYIAAKENNDDSFHFFAASQPYTLSSAYGRRYIKFDFIQDDDTYPLMTQDLDETVRYIAIIECLDVDKNNYYDIQFLQHKNADGHLGDLELNNITYTYKRQADGSTKKALATDEDINASDMYYHIITRSIVQNEILPYDKGVYSFHVVSKDFVNKARVMLRIRKEGAFVVNTDEERAKVFNDVISIKDSNVNNGIKTAADLRLMNQGYNPLELRNNNLDISKQIDAVIGPNITSIHSIDENRVTVNTPVLIRNEDPIYRMAYKVSLKARKVEQRSNPENFEFKHFVLPFTEVFKDFRTTDKTASDRLIFEADLFDTEAGESDYYNDFIVQIYWDNTEMDSSYNEVRKAQMGAIKDIAVSFNQGY